MDNLIEALLQKKEICSDFIEKFSKVYSTTAGSMSYVVKEKTACRLVSKKMVRDALLARKGHVGNLLKSVRKINAIQLETEDDLLEGCHTISSEPYFYDTGYKSSCLKQVTVVDHDKRCLVTQAKCPEVDECALHYMTIPVDEKGRCVLSEQVGAEIIVKGSISMEQLMSLSAGLVFHEKSMRKES